MRSNDSGIGKEKNTSYSDWGPIPKKAADRIDRGDYAGAKEEPLVTADHRAKIEGFFKTLFKDGKSKLGASEGANKFTIEIHGGNGEDHRRMRVIELKHALEDAYDRTFNHEQYDFKKDIDPAETANIQHFVDGLLNDPAALGEVKAKVCVRIVCAKDAKHGVDDCFKAVKDKLKELFDATAKEFESHPGLDPDNQFAAREGDCTLAEITIVEDSSLNEWHFKLPAVLQDGTLGPGSFIGPEKTAQQCPIKFELKFQPHEESQGEADGKLIAWACGNPMTERQLIPLLIKGFKGVKDDACLDHGHGKDGMPGQCMISDGELCAKCVAFGRSKNLTTV